MKTRQYKGCYIDGVIFTSKQNVDNFLKEQTISAYVNAVKMFADDHTMASSMHCDETAERLVDMYGFTWEQVEQLEIETLKQISK